MHDQRGERLWADDPEAPQQLRAIDLSVYDDLVTYPAGFDAPLERKKILFLQTALEMGVPWPDLVRRTRPYFGQTLNAPFIWDVVPSPVEAFTPPPFDISRQTPEGWSEEADKAWIEYRKRMVHQMRERVQARLDDGTLKQFDRSRRPGTDRAGLKNNAIAEEETAFRWAALAFFLGVQASEIAENLPPSGGWQVDPKATTAQKLKAVAAQKRKGLIRSASA
jgi:hypothetical protein